MTYSEDELDQLAGEYRRTLVDEVLPFWLPEAVDQEHGGYLIARDRDGTLVDDDKSVWQQGRFAWLLATLYNTVEPRDEWLEASRSGIQFMRDHCFDPADGRMFFHVTRDGRPLRKRRYYFSECFATIALAAHAKGAGDEQSAEEARALMAKCLDYFEHPEQLPAKFTDTRPAKGIGAPMILLNVMQQLRETIGYDGADDWIDRLITEIREFVRPDIQCVMEQIAPDGSIIDHFDGRTLNPGHAIECAWFILHEAKHRNDAGLQALGCQMLDWMWERGWDKEHGGLLYFTDVYGRPTQEYWHDMKFWWPHNEAEIATLLAYRLSGDERYAGWHRQVRDYSLETFHDPQHGEWFGYVHRDGRLSSTLKGNMWKGPFHMPRMQWYCWRLLASKASG